MRAVSRAWRQGRLRAVLIAGVKGIVLDLGKAVAGLGLIGAVGLNRGHCAHCPVRIDKAIIDATGKPIPERELEGRQETSGTPWRAGT